ncbi:MAG: hypothetical protein ACFCD0_09985 [Gemmataceae bacterium]
MPDMPLSGPGRIVSFVTMGVFGLATIATVIADVPPASWVNDLQGTLTNGSYSPKLTIIALVVPCLGLSWLCGLLFDALTQNGEFRDSDRKRRKRRRRVEWDD